MDLLQGLTASLLIIIGLAAVLLLLRNRGLVRFDVGSRTASKRLQAVERLVLTPQHSLHLVRLDTKLLLVSSAPGGCQILGPFESFSDVLGATRSSMPGAGGQQ